MLSPAEEHVLSPLQQKRVLKAAKENKTTEPGCSRAGIIKSRVRQNLKLNFFFKMSKICLNNPNLCIKK